MNDGRGKTMEKRKYDKVVKKVTYIAVVVVALLVVYVLLLKPFLTFKSYEKQMDKAGRRYYEINSRLLPTGKRVSTVTLKTLSNQKYIDEDFHVPLSSKNCDIENSWVKVKTEGSDYKYYVYLDCGFMESNVDHTGPEIKLNGDKEVTHERFKKFEDPGINNVVDRVDGKMEISDVTVKGKVDIETSGEYKITYTAYDSLNNKTEVTRTINVIDTISSIARRGNSKGYFTGNASNNYIYFSNSLYRIYGLDGDNVRLVSNNMVGIMNFDALDSFTDRYYKALSPKSKRLIVKNKYCKDKLSDSNLDTTECSSYTEERYAYIPSVADINKIRTNEGDFITTTQEIWTANTADKNNSYVNSGAFVDSTKVFDKGNNNSNIGFKPIITIKGNSIVDDGAGTVDDPYKLADDLKYAKSGELVNDRYLGEYLSIDNNTWRIIGIEDDGTTKVILNETLVSDESEVEYNNSGDINTYIYNPKKVNTYGWYVNNKATEYLNMKLFTTHKITVPVYKKDILYGKEIKGETKSYKVKLSVPDVYDLYTIPDDFVGDYLNLNSSKNKKKILVTGIDGAPYYADYYYKDRYSVRPVAFLKKDAKVSSGRGTINEPYIVK